MIHRRTVQHNKSQKLLSNRAEVIVKLPKSQCNSITAIRRAQRICCEHPSRPQLYPCPEGAELFWQYKSKQGCGFYVIAEQYTFIK